MRPIKSVHRLLTAKRRTVQEQAEFITMLRQAAALLSAGRPLLHVWREVAVAHPGCATPPPREDPDPKCCLHHVLLTQSIAAWLSHPFFDQVTAPGRRTHWQQLAATLNLAQATGMSLADILNRFADALEAGEDAQQARDAASAGPKATANLLAWLPVGGLGLAHLLGASVGQLLTSLTGWGLLFGGTALAVLGRWWSVRMIRGAQEP